MRVYIIDCPSPLEILVDESEYRPLEQICKSMNHEVYTFFTKSKKELSDICQYISSIDKIDRNEENDTPICIHISAHGDEKGLQFGKDAVDWEHILGAIKPILKMDYSKEIFLVISACGTDKQRITNEITKLHRDDSSIKPPQYVIVFNKKVINLRDAVLAWTIFYHQADEINLNNKGNVQNLLKRIQKAEFGNLIYYRWDSEKSKYLHYPAKIE